MLEFLKRSTKLFCDETTVPVLDPGRGKTKTGYLWAIARDDRPWNGPDPPGVVYVYAPGRAGEYARQALRGFNGVLRLTDTPAMSADGQVARGLLTRACQPPINVGRKCSRWMGL
jgi:transposase